MNGIYRVFVRNGIHMVYASERWQFLNDAEEKEEQNLSDVA